MIINYDPKSFIVQATGLSSYHVILRIKSTWSKVTTPPVFFWSNHYCHFLPQHSYFALGEIIKKTVNLMFLVQNSSFFVCFKVIDIGKRYTQLKLCLHLYSLARIRVQWRKINCKQSDRWQHLFRLKASAFLFKIFLLGVKKYNLYLRLVTPSSAS